MRFSISDMVIFSDLTISNIVSCMLEHALSYNPPRYLQGLLPGVP